MTLSLAKVSKVNTSKLQQRLWISLKVTFLLILLLVFFAALTLLIQGGRPTRRAAAGLLILPLFSIFYLVRFSKIRRSRWSVISHISVILSALFLGSCLYLHNTAPPVIDAVSPPFLPLICVALVVIGIAVAAVAHFAGYGDSSTRRDG